MDIEELVVIYKEERSWISRRLATIDGLLDRAAYGNASDEEELTEEYDRLEKRLDELKKVEDMIVKVNELNRCINIADDNIDNLACFVGNEAEIKRLNEKIDELEDKKNVLLKMIAKELNAEDKKRNDNKKR